MRGKKERKEQAKSKWKKREKLRVADASLKMTSDGVLEVLMEKQANILR